MSANETTLTPGDPTSGRGTRVAIVVGIAALVGISVWLATGCNRDDTGPAMVVVSSSDAKLVSDGDVAGIPDEVGHEVFWAGDRPDTDVEMSDDPAGNVHLRYLNSSDELGTASQTFLNIGTYPFAGAFQTTRNLTNREGVVRVEVPGGVGFYDQESPYSVILSFADEPDLQVEVYHPEKNAALDVVRSGDIVPVP
ncbi:MAG: hypothetical protein WBP55_10305 [Solirubrobacterales bacterium]